MPASRAYANNTKRKVNESKSVYKSSGNLFRDVGYNDVDAALLLLRSNLMIEIEKVIEENGWTQAQVAQVLGVVQPTISNLMTRRTDKFSVDTLLRYLKKLGREVTVTVKKARVA